MRKLHFIATAILTLAVLLPVTAAHAGETVFARDYTYNASDADSKLSSRAIAMEQVKRILLEELGTYIKSETVIRDSDLTKDEVTVLTAGVVRTDIVQEKWNGETYYIKVRIAADPDRIAESIKELVKQKESLSEVRESRAEADAALKEAERLRAELAAANAELMKLKEVGRKSTVKAEAKVVKLRKQYTDETTRMTAASLWEEGHALYEAERYDEAVALFSEAIEANPGMVRAHGNRGAALNRLGRYEEAVEGFTGAIKLKPKNGKLYWGRSHAYEKLGRSKEARADLEKSAWYGYWKARKRLEGRGEGLARPR